MNSRKLKILLMHNYLLASQHKKGCPPQWKLTRDILTCDFRRGFWLFWCKSETMADGKQRAKGFCYCIILLERERLVLYFVHIMRWHFDLWLRTCDCIPFLDAKLKQWSITLTLVVNTNRTKRSKGTF